MPIIQLAQDTPGLETLLLGANHVDVKTFRSANTLRQFLFRLHGYSPWWMRRLHGLHCLLYRLLGIREDALPLPKTAQDVSFVPGSRASYFTTTAGNPDKFWVGQVDDSPFTVHAVVTKESDIFSIITVVHYKRWTGPAYFNLIRPFHHLVVFLSGRHAAQSGT